MATFSIGGSWEFTTDDHFTIDAPSEINIGQAGGSTINFGTRFGSATPLIAIQATDITSTVLNDIGWSLNGTWSIEAQGGISLNDTAGGLITLGNSSGHMALAARFITMPNLIDSPPAGSVALVYDPSGNQIYQSTFVPSGTTAFLVGGNTGLSSPARFGTNDATEVDMYANNALMIALDTVGNVNIVAPLITINTVEFQDGFNVDASTTSNFHGNTTTLNFLSGTGNEVFIQSGWEWLWESGSFIAGNSGSTLVWAGGATFSGTTAVNNANFSVTSVANTTSLNTATVNIGTSNMATLNVGISTSALNVMAASMSAGYSGAVGYNVVASGAGGINIQSAGTAPFLIGSGASGTFSIVNMPNSGAGAGVYTNANIGAGKAYLVIDTTSGLVTSVIPS